MCGITGYLTTRGDPIQKHLDRMAAILAHRGPDDADTFHHTPDGGEAIAGLAHRRLSVIDHTDAGRQPMAEQDERLWITYNGEIYNFEDLREELEAEGYSFASETDTEVVLKGYHAWGRDVLPRLNGMFAFAILDLRNDEPELLLARDRVGQKPLYYTRDGTRFAFASEMKALLEAPDFEATLDPTAVNEYLAFLWVPEPRTVVDEIRKVPPGHWMRVTPDAVDQGAYWTFDLEDDAGDRSEDELREELRNRLERAFHRTTRADVPVGAFLSGGLDSSAIVSLLTRDGFDLDRVYTMATDPEDQAYEGFPDDARYARDLADELDLDQVESVMDPEMASRLPDLIWHLDEPLADPAVLPLHAMCADAGGDLKVLLSGMGADELFGGYRRHAIASLVEAAAHLPGSLRRAAARGVDLLPSAGAHRLAPTFRRAQRVARALAHDDPYVGLASWTTAGRRREVLADPFLEWARPEEAGRRIQDHLADAEDQSLIHRMLLGDTRVYLPSHNLNYTDKISMAESVEVRSPFLDNELLEFAAQLPSDQKVRRGDLKVLLKDAVADLLPDAILERSKAGFGAPIRAWLSGPLKDLLDDALAPDRVEERGIFDPEAVEDLKADLQEGREDTSYLLWAILVLQLWLDTYDVEVPSR